MPRRDDEDDWVGTPPEGRHSPDRANPAFWRNQSQAIYAGSLLGVFVVLAVALILLLG